MTLQQKFEQAPDVYNANFEVVKDYSTIADDFAIGFGQWLIKKEHEYTNKIIAMEELLQIYKKEKGL